MFCFTRTYSVCLESHMDYGQNLYYGKLLYEGLVAYRYISDTKVTAIQGRSRAGAFKKEENTSLHKTDNYY